MHRGIDMKRIVLVSQFWPIAAAASCAGLVAIALGAGGEVDAKSAELGVAAYPGAMLAPGGAKRTRTPEATTVRAAFESTDSVEQVAAFYRKQLRSTSASQQLFDDPTQGRVSLMLSHGPMQRSVTVDIDRSRSGTSIQVVSSVPTTTPMRRCIARSGVCPRPVS
jgi:hypothetical protein